MELFAEIDALRERWNVLRHPFYTRWEHGELSREELAFYAGEYRHAVVALAGAAAVSGDDGHAREEREHVALWDDFAAALDAPLDREPLAGTRGCAEAWGGGGDRLESLAVLYAVESGQPAISETKLRGLVEHYGFAEGPASEYFALHAKLDVEHAREARAQLEREAGDADTGRLVAAAERALRGNWELLDGVDRSA